MNSEKSKFSIENVGQTVLNELAEDLLKEKKDKLKELVKNRLALRKQLKEIEAEIQEMKEALEEEAADLQA